MKILRQLSIVTNRLVKSLTTYISVLSGKKYLDVLKKSEGPVILMKNLGQMNPDLMVLIKKISHIWGSDSHKAAPGTELSWLVFQQYMTSFWPPVSQIWFLKRFGCQRHPVEIRKRKIQIQMKASLKTTKKIMKCTAGSTLCWQTDCNFCCQGLTFCKHCHRK